MTPDDAKRSEESRIVSDDDWKERVKAEDAALDREFADQSESTTARDSTDTSAGTEADVGAEAGSSEVSPDSASVDSASAEASPDEQAATQRVDSGSDSAASSEAREIPAGELPPASFATLVGMFSTQAMVSLGLIPNPATGQAETHLDLARHFIDLLGVLDRTTKGNLEPAEASMLESALHELRMIYVERSKAEGQ